jgi:hypothetical protein
LVVFIKFVEIKQELSPELTGNIGRIKQEIAVAFAFLPPLPVINPPCRDNAMQVRVV